MRLGFGELKRIRQRARERVEHDGQGFIERWWSAKYGAPANDTRFITKSLAAHVQEFYEDLAVELRDVKVALKDPKNDDRVSLLERERWLEAVLTGTEDGFDPDHDPEVERWIAQVRRGENPDYRDKMKWAFPRARREE